MDQSDLSFDHYKKFLNMFPQLRHINLQGEGEPLLNPYFFTMVEYAVHRNIKVSFISNASLFTPANVEQILRSGIHSIRVSLETAKPTTFLSLRGFSITEVKSGISLLLSERNKQSLKTPSVGFALTVLSSTLEDVYSVFDLYSNLGMDGGIAIQTLSTEPFHSGVYDEEMTNEYLSNYQKDRLFSIVSDAKVHTTLNRTSPNKHFYDELFPPREEGVRERSITACPWLENALNIDRHGRITPCCPVKAERWAFGTIDELNQKLILKAKTEIANELKNGIIPTPCQGCRIANILVNK
jgi:radical SAM protein with 4Fe4S-binding SPASM domain